MPTPAPPPLEPPELSDPTEQTSPLGLSVPLAFGLAIALLTTLWDWPIRWLFSGAPILSLCILVGAAEGYRILPFVHGWTLLATINLAYALAATSWLLYWVYASTCYPVILLTCIFQFDFAANLARKALRSVLKQLQFVNDMIALFDLPALEIDTDVLGLMVIRGLTISLSTLTITAHGIEVGIRLSNDIELAIQTEKVVVQLFRRIDISDCFANLKGGEYEMTFGSLEEAIDEDGDALMVQDTPLLKMAASTGDTRRPPLVKMRSRMTNDGIIRSATIRTGMRSVKQLSPDDRKARKQYDETLKWISETGAIMQCRQQVETQAKNKFDNNGEDMRAAICSQLHDMPSIPHPPKLSVKVTTLQNLSPPWLRQFLHRLPLLLRLLLNPMSYFHPISITSITAAGSGKWITYMLRENVFKHYGEHNAEIRRLEKRISSWLSDANFAAELLDITGIAQVPVITAFDIICQLTIRDVMAYRTLPKDIDLKQVVRVGGADATFTIPSFLLPHHEHLLPPIPTVEDKESIANDIEESSGTPKAIQKQYDLEQAEKDEANVKLNAHVSLPACFDQELLDFVAALVKATKVVEMEKEPESPEQDVKGLKDFTHSISQSMRDGMKKAAVSGMMNDRWIAKMVGRITKKLETVQGNVGYACNIPVALEEYRLPPGSKESAKLLK